MLGVEEPRVLILTGAVDSMAAILLDVVVKDLGSVSQVSAYRCSNEGTRRWVAKRRAASADFQSNTEAKPTMRAGSVHARQYFSTQCPA
jgi:hypothetical protein